MGRYNIELWASMGCCKAVTGLLTLVLAIPNSSIYRVETHSVPRTVQWLAAGR